MYNNHLGFSLRDLTYILSPEQSVILADLTGNIVYDGQWLKCNHISNEEVIDITVFESLNHYRCLLITFKEHNNVY